VWLQSRGVAARLPKLLSIDVVPYKEGVRNSYLRHPVYFTALSAGVDDLPMWIAGLASVFNPTLHGFRTYVNLAHAPHQSQRRGEGSGQGRPSQNSQHTWQYLV
jgi:hypothetical protein